MRTSSPIAVAVSAAFLLLTCFASDPVEAEYPEAGWIHLSFSPDEIVQDLTVDAVTPFDFYLLFEVDHGAGDPDAARVMAGALNFSSEIFISEIEWTQWAADVGQGLSTGNYDFGVAFADCLELADGLNVACRFRALAGRSTTRMRFGGRTYAPSPRSCSKRRTSPATTWRPSR